MYPGEFADFSDGTGFDSRDNSGVSPRTISRAPSGSEGEPACDLGSCSLRPGAFPATNGFVRALVASRGSPIADIDGIIGRVCASLASFACLSSTESPASTVIQADLASFVTRRGPWHRNPLPIWQVASFCRFSSTGQITAIPAGGFVLRMLKSADEPPAGRSARDGRCIAQSLGTCSPQ